jgi:hypothetical protein
MFTEIIFEVGFHIVFTEINGGHTGFKSFNPYNIQKNNLYEKNSITHMP